MLKTTLLAATLVLLGSMASADHHASGVHVSGFMDAQYQFNRGTVNFGTTNAATETLNGFSLNQGAIYISKEMDGAMMHIDIPFAGSGSSANNNFSIATGQAQAYFTNTYDMGLSWTLGQFDTPFGFEGNDTNDLIFAQQGVVFSVMPTTHLGLKLGYSVMGLDLALMLSNQNGQSANVATSDHEMGFQASWANDQFRARAGVLMNAFNGTQVNKAADAETEMLVDIGFGGTFGKIMADISYSMISNKSGEENVSATVERDDIVGLLAQVSYDVCEKSKVALRYENLTGDLLAADLAGATVSVNDSKRQKIALGYSMWMTKNLNTKVEVSTNSAEVDAVNGSESWTEGRIAGVFNF